MKILNYLKIKNFSKNLAETISLGLILYIVLVCFALCIGLGLTTFFNTDNGDIPAIISNMFVWSATLFAPIIAILILNAWRYQKNFEADSFLLNSAQENLIKFHTETDLVCRTVVSIYETYSQDQSYFMAHSLLRKPHEISNQFLDNFYLHMERYLNYHEDIELRNLFNEYYGIANDFLYINKTIISDYYSSIYYKLKSQSLGDGWIDSKLTIIFPNNSPEKSSIESLYSSFNIRYEHTGSKKEPDMESGEMKLVKKSYKEYYQLMQNLYKEINFKIKEINRA